MQWTPPFHTIPSAIDTSAYKLAQLFLELLQPSTTNKYIVIDSFHFAEEICQQDSNLHMANLDINPLFTKYFPR